MQLLKFYASWCNPCKTLSDILKDIHFPYEIIAINIDENPELSLKYDVKTIPTLILLDNDNSLITKVTGSNFTREELINLFINK